MTNTHRSGFTVAGATRLILLSANPIGVASQIATTALLERLSIMELTKSIQIPRDAAPTAGGSLFSNSAAKGRGAWFFERKSQIPEYLQWEATQGRVFVRAGRYLPAKDI